MTEETLKYAIANLILKRQNTDHNDVGELNRINVKLAKLYDLKYILLSQKGE